jgi:hypothetical protein
MEEVAFAIYHKKDLGKSNMCQVIVAKVAGALWSRMKRT